MKLRYQIVFLLFFAGPFLVRAQYDHFRYQRPIDGITEEWHKLSLPDEIFEKLRADFHDIRVIGIKNDGDTVEAPYILKSLKDKSIEKTVQFKRINDTRKGGAYYFTFEISEPQAINEIELYFVNQNFDWRVRLEGSHDQKEWFELLDNYRILSIKNDQTSYSFTNLRLSLSNYRFLRLRIDSSIIPKLNSASIHHFEKIEGKRRNYTEKALKIHEDKNQTILDINLKRSVPVSGIKMEVGSDYDYYRPITIQYLSDSFETEKGWKYRYSILKKATLSSLEKNPFTFTSSTLRQLRIIVENHDNEPLEIVDCEVWDYERVLIARFTEEASYSMYYGNPIARRPIYDLNYFSDQIPEQLIGLQLGTEQEQLTNDFHEEKALFIHKYWLWAILLVVIGLLGYFSIQMINNKKSQQY